MYTTLKKLVHISLYLIPPAFFANCNFCFSLFSVFCRLAIAYEDYFFFELVCTLCYPYQFASHPHTFWDFWLPLLGVPGCFGLASFCLDLCIDCFCSWDNAMVQPCKFPKLHFLQSLPPEPSRAYICKDDFGPLNIIYWQIEERKVYCAKMFFCNNMYGRIWT